MKPMIFITVLFSGLVAGLFYAYSCSVNKGLSALTDAEYLKAMQAINAAIQNPLFFLTFMGLLLLFPVTCYQLRMQGLVFNCFLAAGVVYFIGVFALTVFGNVPLNEQLANFSISEATEEQLLAMREAFERPWNNYHTLRTFAAVISFGLTLLALL